MSTQNLYFNILTFEFPTDNQTFYFTKDDNKFYLLLKRNKVISMPRHFSCHSFIGTAAHDSQFPGANSTAQSKSLVHPTANESLPLHCRDTFALCQRH